MSLSFTGDLAALTCVVPQHQCFALALESQGRRQGAGTLPTARVSPRSFGSDCLRRSFEVVLNRRLGIRCEFEESHASTELTSTRSTGQDGNHLGFQPTSLRSPSLGSRLASAVGRHRSSSSCKAAEWELTSSMQSDTTGDIATCSGAILRVWTVNGELLATQPTSNFVDPITAVAFSKVSCFLPSTASLAHLSSAVGDGSHRRHGASGGENHALASRVVRRGWR